MKLFLLAALLAAPGVRAQNAAPVAPPAGYGVSVEGGDWVYRGTDAASAPRVLSADERSRISLFFASLPVEGRDASLAAPLLARLAREDGDPAATGWFEGDAAAPRLTASGRAALTAALLDAAPSGSASQTPRLAALNKRLSGIANAPDFDGTVSHADAAAVAETIASPLPPSLRPSAKDLASLPDSPTPQAVPKPKPLTRGESFANDAFWSTWWGYHAAWAADFTTTGMILSRGGYEKDSLYTRFGNKNMAGVIGSAAVVHAGLSVASLVLHEEAKKRTGFKRYALETAAIALNSTFIVVHADAAAGNAGVLQNWNSR